jgi:hypothetical protein
LGQHFCNKLKNLIFDSSNIFFSFFYSIFILLLLLEEEMELEWSVDKGDEVVGESRIIPIIFIWHRWKKKVSESHRLCFSFSLWSGFLLTRTTNTLCDKYGIGEAGASLSLSLSHTHTHTRKAEVLGR